MTRPSRDEVLLEIAWDMSRRSSCSRNHVGVVIARDGRILSTGYNGAPAGLDHCDHSCSAGCMGEQSGAHMPGCHGIEPCIVSIHAEANAIAHAARFGAGLEGASLYTTLSPCLPCAQLVVAAGITSVTYGSTYRDHAGLDYLEYAGLDIGQLVH